MNKKDGFILVDALCALSLMICVGLMLFISILHMEINHKKTIELEKELIQNWLEK